MATVGHPRLLVQRVVRCHACVGVEEEEGRGAVVDAELEPPVGLIGLAHLVELVGPALVLAQEVDRVVNLP